MYIPFTYTAQLAFKISSMVSWGSWANSVKLAPGWRFQSFYWDYVLGVLLDSFVFGVALGRPGFPAGLFHASGTYVLLGILAGVVFNVANQL